MAMKTSRPDKAATTGRGSSENAPRANSRQIVARDRRNGGRAHLLRLRSAPSASTGTGPLAFDCLGALFGWPLSIPNVARPGCLARGQRPLRVLAWPGRNGLQAMRTRRVAND